MATLLRATYPEAMMVVLGPGDALPAYRAPGEEVHPANGRDFTLAEAQALVGGMVEVLHLDRGLIMMCNEEGKLEGLPVNVEATIIFRRTFGPRDTIVGDVVVCKDSELR